ncbi:MAG: hypothetical protein P1P88_10360 [Bacteroidales bacterium]|nr:hypothetical protein [Bacteroidales bacterium]
MKKNKHIIILFVLFTLLVVFEYMAPKPPDWRPSFRQHDKIPYGSYIMYDLLPDIFPKSKIEKNEKSLYQTFTANEFSNTSYIVITNEFDPKSVTLEALLNFVSLCNKAFIASSVFGEKFMDTLNFTNRPFISNFIKGDSLPYNFLNRHLQSDSAYWIKSGFYNFYFDSVNYEQSKAIAILDTGKVNYFRQKFGMGEFFIHNQPYAFTNYNLLFENNADYAFKSLSYLDNANIIWDENFKPGKVSSSPLSYILSQEALRAAWYLILFLALVFLFFSSKRKQRIIPIIVPPENNSLEFAKTLGNLYLSGKNHKDIALKKYSYWLDFLREKYYIHIEPGEVPETGRIAEKTGVNEKLIQRIISAAMLLKNSSAISSEQLLSFNQLVEKFHASRK